MDEFILSRSLLAAFFWRLGPNFQWLGPNEAYDRLLSDPQRGVHDTLEDSQWGLISGLRILKVQRTEAMDDDAQKNAFPEHSQPADDFAAMFEAERRDIARVCYRLLNDPTTVEDATSEVFLRARRALSSYDREQPFRPWLRAIASNYCIDELRRQKTERKLFSQADLSEEGLADAAPDILTCLARSEDRREVLAAIVALPAMYRIPLVLRFYRDLDYDSIAELLNIGRNQVGSLLFRAKKQLRQRLAHGIDDATDEAIDDPATFGASDGGKLSARNLRTRRRKPTRRPSASIETKRSAKP